MGILKKTFSSDNFELNWRRFLLQGMLILGIGITVALSSILNSDAVLMSAQEFSWLPLIGFIIFALGLQELIEALFSKISREFHQNIQVGILDTVVGGLIILSVSDDPQRLGIMIAAFLIVRGSVRIALVNALGLPQAISTSIFGAIAIGLGFLLFLQWPTKAAWFISLCLSIEIAFRGWAMMMFAIWIKNINRTTER